MSAFYVERNNTGGNGIVEQGQQSGSTQQRPMNSENGMPSGSMGQMPQGQTANQGSAQQGSTQQGSTQQGTNGQNGSHLDYRDDLRELLDKAHAEKGLTRYRLCKQMGIDSGTLSNVLAKRRHFSLEKLEQILGLLGYRLSFTPVENGSKGIQ